MGRLAQRRGAGTAQEAFPGQVRWRSYLLLREERIAAPLRVAVVLVTLFAFLTLPPARGTQPALAWSILGLSVAYAAGALFAVFRRPDAVRARPFLSAFVDGLLAVGWVLATGGRDSPYRDLFFLVTAGSAFRLPRLAALAFAATQGLVLVLLQGPRGLVVSGYLLLVALGLAIRHDLEQTERTSSMRDSLTGCFGRAYALFQLQELFAREAFPFAVGILDMDGFKLVNDTYGHSAGDYVLREATRLIDSLIRAEDLLARYGGDEFLIIWPGAGAEEAAGAAERIRAHLEKSSLRLRQPQVHIHQTVSIGVAVASRGCTLSRLLEAADESLYEAKRARNCVVLAHEVAS